MSIDDLTLNYLTFVYQNQISHLISGIFTRDNNITVYINITSNCQHCRGAASSPEQALRAESDTV